MADAFDYLNGYLDPMLAYRYQRDPNAPQQPLQYQTAPDTIPLSLDRTPAPDTGQGTWWSNARQAAGDIGTAATGLAERFNKGVANTLGFRQPGGDIYRAEIPVGPGLERAGDVLNFATGGLQSSLFPAAGSYREAARFAAPAAREAARDVLPELQRLVGDEAGAVRLPGLSGAPPQIKTMADLADWRERQVQAALEGQSGRQWYRKSGEAIGELTGYEPGGDPTRATKLAEGVGITSPQTPVPANANYAVQGHNMAMAGDPISNVGFFPGTMSPKLNDVYWHDAPWGGRKTNAYTDSFLHELGILPDEPGLVNDIWEMRGNEYAGGEAGRTKGGLYSGSPTEAQYNWSENEARNLVSRLNERLPPGEEPWNIKQVQASKWTRNRAEELGIPIEKASYDIGDAFGHLTGQHSYESIPGVKTGHLPEMHSADMEVKRAFHRDIVEAMTDPNTGRDIINSHFGLLTGRTFDAPGGFEGNVNPGSQARSVLGTMKGTGSTLVDPYSRELADTADFVRGIVLGQDAQAWHRPFYRQGDALKNRNLTDVMLGRRLSFEEQRALYDVVTREAGTDFFSPIGSPTGARFLNVPDETGIAHPAFQKHIERAVREVFGPSTTPGDVEVVHRLADSGYTPIDWKGILGGADYRAGAPTRRPDLLRRADELVSTLGPKVAPIHDRYASRYGWTVNPGIRVWERPGALPPSEALTPPTPWTSGGVTPSGLIVPKRPPPKPKGKKGGLGDLGGIP
jgi:hypothetical protein